MKIIEKPDVDGWEYPCTCVSCDTKLMIEASDLTYSYYKGDVSSESYESFEANCIVCKKMIAIDSNKIPQILKIELANKYNSKLRGSYWDR